MTEPGQDVVVIKDGAPAGATLVVDSELRLGRDAQGVASLGGDPRLSRWHARLSRDGAGTLVIEDLSSSNGTYVNGVRVTKPRRLSPGDLVLVGGTTLEVRWNLIDDSATMAVGDLPLPSEQIGSPSSQHSSVPKSALPPLANLVHQGKRVLVPVDGLTIGRLPENHIVIDSERVSRHHARIVASQGRHYIADLDSRNGTYLNGERLIKEARWLNAGDEITIGGEPLRFLAGRETAYGLEFAPQESLRTIRFAGARMTIGRDESNEIVLDGPAISRFHAEIINSGGVLELRDLGSRNGTRLNGEVVRSAPLAVGSQIGIGPYRLTFDGSGFVERDDRGSLRLDAFAVSVVVRGRTLLDRATLSVQPGEFMAVIGESGSGKTTLLKAMAGITDPSDGAVLVNGDPVRTRLTEVGYLPQDEIVHARLTVLESLRYSARLRLPQDSSAEDIEDAVARVVREMSLQQQVDTRIGSLSGGQRKRVGLATELLNRPGLLFLDEPTTGLDPGLEGRMMALFRELAAVGRHAIIVVTHATKSLAAADKLCVMGRGGNVCYVGPPEGATAFFHVDSFDDIYSALEDRAATEWRQIFEAGSARVPAAPDLPDASVAQRRVRTRGRELWRTQTTILTRRYLKVFSRDRRNVLILLLQVPLLAVGVALLFKPDVFGPVAAGHASAASQLAFLLIVITVWLGAVDSSREIVKERPMFARENAVGVDIRAYLASKVALLFTLVLAQALVLVTIVLALRPLGASGIGHVGLLVTVLLTGFAAVTMGLAISALVNTDDQATAVLPISMIVQLLLGGAIVTIKNMGHVMGLVSSLAFARWSYAGVGRSIDMNARIAADPTFGSNSPYAHSFFALRVPVGWAILLSFSALFLAAAFWSLQRRSRA